MGHFTYAIHFFEVTVGWARFFAHAERSDNTWAKERAHPTKLPSARQQRSFG